MRLIERLAARLRIPGEYRELAVIVARYHGIVHRAFELKPQTIVEFLEKSDAFRRPERFERALLACEADARGRSGFETAPYPQRAFLIAAREAAAAIKPAPNEIRPPYNSRDHTSRPNSSVPNKNRADGAAHGQSRFCRSGDCTARSGASASASASSSTAR